MIRSMTGFSSTILTLPKPGAPEHQIHLSMSLKTLNARFFELNCKLPYSLSFLETDLIKLFKASLYRGTIQFMVHISDPSALTGSISPALPTVRGYLSALEAIQSTYSVPGSIEIGDLIALPNIFETREAPLDTATIERIMAAIHMLIESCDQVRLKEGAALKVDLKKRIEIMQSYFAALEPRALLIMEQKKAQLFETLASVMKETTETFAESQKTLVYNQLERIDIHEEIIRFNTHLASLLATIDSPDIEKGKKLDFTLQELFREINTIASKCGDSHISSLAINVKVELEKSREQAQNIV